jgi:formylglycine-generating enzyme required for sulfatase activity
MLLLRSFASLTLGSLWCILYAAPQQPGANPALPNPQEASQIPVPGIRSPLTPGSQHHFGEIATRWIPPGRFLMGSPQSEADRDSDEDQHEVVLTHGFFMAETECSQSLYESVTGSNPAAYRGPNQPVEKVTWDDANAFCELLTAQHQHQGILPQGWEWQLPTEAQWEYACRAGTTTPRYGNLDAIAWHRENCIDQHHNSGALQPNDWGLYDMLGNVWEWCSDFYSAYPTNSVTDPTGPSTGHYRTLRGASWYDKPYRARSAYRFWLPPEFTFATLGIRPVLVPVSSSKPAIHESE